MFPRNLRPIQLSRRAEPFDSDQHIFELKIDGFRALAHIDAGQGQLISRNGNTFRGFADLAAWISEHLRVESAVLDGEIACVDDSGRPVFRDLLFRRRQVFIAFDLLYLNGKDLRTLPLIERKPALKKLLRRKRSRILYLDHVSTVMDDCCSIKSLRWIWKALSASRRTHHTRSRRSLRVTGSK